MAAMSILVCEQTFFTMYYYKRRFLYIRERLALLLYSEFMIKQLEVQNASSIWSRLKG